MYHVSNFYFLLYISYKMFDSVTTVCYYLITYAIKTVVFFVFLTFWKCSNMFTCVIVFFIVFTAMDFILVRFLPNCAYKNNVLKNYPIPNNFYTLLAVDYIIKAFAFYYVYIYYYLSLNSFQQMLVIYLVMAGIDILFAYAVTYLGKPYSEHFMCVCSM